MKAGWSASTGCLIVINCGSSSLKFAVFSSDDETVLLKGVAGRLGTPDALLEIERDEDIAEIPIPFASHYDALQAIVARMGGLYPRGVGHRVVHGAVHSSANTIAVTAIQSARDYQD